jgi:hypothetical protein
MSFLYSPPFCADSSSAILANHSFHAVTFHIQPETFPVHYHCGLMAAAKYEPNSWNSDSGLLPA